MKILSKINNKPEEELYNGVSDSRENKRVGKRTIEFKNEPKIIAASSIGGKMEQDGAIGKYFDLVADDDNLGQETFEKAERMFLKRVFKDVCQKIEGGVDSIDYIVSGDLMNQITTSNFVARELDRPYLGVYSACSSMTESMCVGSMLVDGGYANKVMCGAASHFSSVERLYRFPLEQGTQRTPLSQRTVTGAGCSVIAYGDYDAPKIKRATVGKVIDFGILDANNMGAAMAPAPMDTLVSFFEDTNTMPEDYDLILTGDLGFFGKEIFIDLMKDRGYSIINNYQDCGAMIYPALRKNEQGGSGAGCSACVFNSLIYKKLKRKEIKKMLFLATGALMSQTTSQQGDTIPAISHLVEIEA